VGSEDHQIASAETLVAHPVFHDLAHDAALGVPEHQARPGQFLNAEQVELLAEQTMIAFGCFFKARKVLVHGLLRKESCAVNTLQLGILFVAQPVSAGQREHLESFHAAG
jgi:hypothetical protein